MKKETSDERLIRELAPLVDDRIHTEYIEDIHCDNCNLLCAYFDEEKQTSVTMDVPSMCWLENVDKNVKTIYFCSSKCFDEYFGVEFSKERV